MRHEETEVLIVGGGPVGLALATELNFHGVRSVVVERQRDPGLQPGAKLVNIRSMELLRRWGLAHAVRQASVLGVDWPLDIAYVTRLAGYSLARIHVAGGSGDDASPEGPLVGSQRILETILRQQLHASAHVAVEEGTELLAFRQDADGVTATVRGDEGEWTIRARWLTGCDGAQSIVRKALGIGMSGRARFADNLAIVFEADLLPLLERHGKAIQYWTVNPDSPGIIGPLDGEGRWWMHINAQENSSRWTAADIVEHIQGAVGSRIDCEVLDVSPWASHQLIADSYRSGRVLLLGDAAHLHPPMGGYGMNTGIGDSVDVGWKLSAVLQGWAPEALLNSYEQERRPVHRLVIEEAVRNYGTLSASLYQHGAEAPDGDDIRLRMGEEIVRAKSREFQSKGLQLGYRYDPSAIVVPDGTPPPVQEVGEYVPTARPGHLLPHFQMSDGRSLRDLLGSDFTLLVTDPTANTTPLVECARGAGMRMRELALAEVPWRSRLGAALLLVRPDHHVAWRGERFPVPASVLLDIVRGVAL